jgi:5-methylcytosine-specific restriction endonuclease McrA
MTEALKTSYDTLTTNLRHPDRGPDYYLEKWKRRQGLQSRIGGGKLEKFQRISRYQQISPETVLEGDIPRVFVSEYHFYRWNVGAVLCVYCNVRLTRENRTQDHVIPRAKGGSQLGYDNLEPSCQNCNWTKGDTNLLLFLLEKVNQ